MNEPKIAVEIPRVLYDHLAAVIAASRFRSVPEFIVHVLTDVAYEDNEHQREFSPRELTRIKDKLKLLGYL